MLSANPGSSCRHLWILSPIYSNQIENQVHYAALLIWRFAGQTAEIAAIIVLYNPASQVSVDTE